LSDVVLVALSCGVLGLIFGSFANVVIYRVPAGQSLTSPPSTCPGCEQRIKPYDNIPVVSWLALRGRCRHCDQRISATYPLVELSMALVWAAVGARIGLDWTLPGYLLFAWLLVVVAVIDARTRKIPNRLTYPLTPALLVLMVAAALLNGEPDRILPVVLGGVGGFLGLLVLALIQPKGMGMGDVKLAGFIGIGLGYLGWEHVLLGLFGGFLLGGVISIVLIATRARGRRDMIPFGPYLSAGAILALLVGEPIIDAYKRSLGL
jgi:leader peptidase (prepilin peptidase) / N-methyltransferase